MYVPKTEYDKICELKNIQNYVKHIHPVNSKVRYSKKTCRFKIYPKCTNGDDKF